MSEIGDQLLRIKRLHENSAVTEMRKRRHALEEAARTVERTRGELEDYRTWRTRRETELFDEIEQRLVDVGEIEDLKATIGLMRDKEHVIEQQLMEAEKAREAAKEALDEADRAWRAAMRDVRKYEELVAVWDEAEAREADYRAEVEMEDFRTRPSLTAEDAP